MFPFCHSKLFYGGVIFIIVGSFLSLAAKRVRGCLHGGQKILVPETQVTRRQNNFSWV